MDLGTGEMSQNIGLEQDFSALDVVTHDCGGDGPMHHRMFHSIPGLYPLVQPPQPPPSYNNQKCLVIAKSPMGSAIILVENHVVIDAKITGGITGGIFPFFFLAMASKVPLRGKLGLHK